MLRQAVFVTFCALMLASAGPAFAGMDPDLALYWPLDEGAGTAANDLTGNGHNGTIAAGPVWVTPGKIGDGAIQFTGTGDIRGSHVAIDNRSFTIAMWVNPTLPSGSQIVFSTQSSSATGLNLHLRIGGPGASDAPVNGIRFGFYNIDLDSPANVLTANTWHHLTFRYDFEAQQKTLFLNGVQIAQNASTAFLATTGDVVLGSWAGSNYFTGIVDDLMIYQRALSP
ncbi:MAG: LamG domain-containing protein, partial [Solirubrobacterales bacterium]